MKKIIKILYLSLLISLSISFISLADVGMTKVGGGKDGAVLCCLNDDGEYLKNQWKQAWGYWYYFGEDGESKNNTWARIDGKWYYFNEWSRMIHDTTTPDGYTVGSDGAWIKDGQVVVESSSATEVTNN